MTDDQTITETTESAPDSAGETPTEAPTAVVGTDETSPKTFDEAYVKDLRDEAAKYRTKAKDRDALAQRLHAALVAADGRLQDPSDLNFDEAHLDGTALQDAITDLVTRKPHLAARKVAGDVGQGSRNGTGTVDLLGMLRGNN